jgi:hypothetical protein
MHDLPQIQSARVVLIDYYWYAGKHPSNTLLNKIPGC